MIQLLTAVDASTLSGFDDVIDVRSPSEYAEDHIDGAVSLPVLSDAERAEVGTIYVQESKFKARRIGAAYIAGNIAGHLRGALRDKPGGYAPLVYCWRGGQRSNAMATVLSQIGWRTSLIEGGYKTYRSHVTAALYDAEPAWRLVLLGGGTGTGKTEILARLGRRGVQTLDLEALAGHRGSLLGALPGQPQPSQKMFETRLLSALAALDPSRPVVAEAESSKIGDRNLPPMLWKAMGLAGRIELRVPMPERARYLASAYRDICEDMDGLQAALARLPAHHSGETRRAWRDMARTGAFEALAQGLIAEHYDPAYARSADQTASPGLGLVVLDRLDEAGQEAAADEIARIVAKAFSAA